MATPVRKLIIDDIFSTLKTIGTLANAKTAPVKVERVIKEWDSSGPKTRPWVGFRPQKSVYQYQPFGRIEAKMRVDVVGHVTGNDDESRANNANDLLDDIIAALQVDTRRGGNAISTTLLEDDTDEGDPDTPDSSGGGGSVALVFEVFYERTTGIS